MKKRCILFILPALGLSLLLASCFSSGKVVETTFDPSRPASLSSTVLFWLDIQTYNNIDVREAWGKENDTPLVTLPDGEAEFTFNAYFSRDYGRVIEHYTINDCKFSFKFEGGKDYTVRWFLDKKPKKFLQPQEYEYYVRIYGKLPRDMKGWSSNSDLKEDDLIVSLFMFDTEDFKK